MGIAGGTLPVVSMRYNLVRRWLEVQDATVPGGLRVLPVGSIRGFILAETRGQNAHEFGAYLGPSGEGRLFLEELTPKGPVHLLVRHDVETIAPVRNPALNVEMRTGAERQYTSLYVHTPAHPEARTLALNRKAVLKLFGNRTGQLADYATQQHLSYSSLADVMQLVEQYNHSAPVPTPAK